MNGGSATARAYVTAAHVRGSAEPWSHGAGGGWYDCEFQRTDDGWRIARSWLIIKWMTGHDLSGGDPGQ